MFEYTIAVKPECKCTLWELSSLYYCLFYLNSTPYVCMYSLFSIGYLQNQIYQRIGRLFTPINMFYNDKNVYIV